MWVLKISGNCLLRKTDLLTAPLVRVQGFWEVSIFRLTYNPDVTRSSSIRLDAFHSEKNSFERFAMPLTLHHAHYWVVLLTYYYC